ncbi:rhomboid family intramembrane serine protease [Chelatococcus sambhunathii]|uniref:Rhomboid family intramembrane serine protease n=1 Tax=Chelatococcus sambhunathii TaxID=363953 RepID=A0ABU1DJR2_9HYPH|nr:rhomboid family intramembrane serine protease [Chelatococcus sambhunathii]
MSDRRGIQHPACQGRSRARLANASASREHCLGGRGFQTIGAQVTDRREPIFNAPAAVVTLIVLFTAIHIGRSFLPEEADLEVLLRFAFIPARYDEASQYFSELASFGAGPKIWTFLSYAFLHGGWTHLLVNSICMLAFGSAVAWRFGTGRFLLFSGLTAAAGAATHLALHFGQPTPVVGASAAISAHMAAAMRFVFQAGGPLSALRSHDRAAFSAPAEPIGKALRRPQIIGFLAAWFGANLLFGLSGGALTGDDANVAWEAHIGGFLAGLLLFPLLDPTPREREPSAPEDAWAETLRQDVAGPHDGGRGDRGRSTPDN